MHFAPRSLDHPACTLQVDLRSLDHLTCTVQADLRSLPRLTCTLQVDLRSLPRLTCTLQAGISTLLSVNCITSLNLGRLTPAGVLIGWTWQGYSKFLDMLELQVDRGDGNGFGPLTFDTTPGYTDTHPQPAALTQWKYRGIFHVEDTTVGQWSEVVTSAVGG